jgi:peptidoglycan/LPS O-acetylase OafA/YrhL
MTTRRPALGSHLAALDGVRGLAIVLVMFVHFVGDLTPHGGLERAIVKVSNYGTWGVDLFFVLSGFLITGILWDSKASPRYFRDFYIRRTLRIFPLYYAVLAVLFVMLPLMPWSYPASLGESAKHQAWVWTYLTNFYVALQKRWALPYVSHFWSLAVEEHFYLVWPCIVLVSSRATLLRVCVFAVVLALALRLFMAQLGAGEVALLTVTPCRLDALCIGAFIAVAARPDGIDRLARIAKPALGVTGALVLTLSVWHAFVGIFDVITLPTRGTAMALFFGAVIVLAITADRGTMGSRFLSSRVMRSLGKYSYGLYVFHGIVAYWVQERQQGAEWLTARLGSHLLAMGVQALAGAALSLLLAALSYEMFEKHLLRLKDRWAPSRGARLDPAAAFTPGIHTAGTPSGRGCTTRMPARPS